MPLSLHCGQKYAESLLDTLFNPHNEHQNNDHWP